MRSKKPLLLLFMLMFVSAAFMYARRPPVPANAAEQAEPAEEKAVLPESEQTKQGNANATWLMTNDDQTLWLVNTSHPIGAFETDAELVSAYPNLPLMNSSIRFRSEMLDALCGLFDAAEAEGFSLIVTDGYRTETEQADLYNAAADKTYAQPAGASEHQTGLAADVASRGCPARTWPEAKRRNG